MKKQIITLVIGILIGAVITAGVFLIAKPRNSRQIPDFSKFGGNMEEFRKEGRGRDRTSSDDKKTEEKSSEKDSIDEKQS